MPQTVMYTVAEPSSGASSVTTTFVRPAERGIDLSSAQNYGLHEGSDEWQDFRSNGVLEMSTEKSCTFTELSFQVMSSCFKTSSEKSSEMVERTVNRHISYEHRLSILKSELCESSCQLIPSELIRRHVKDKTLADMTRHQLHLDLPAECNNFEWNFENSLDTISPMEFRPGLPESPISIEFDYGRATLGLAELSEPELNAMTQEMETKFTHLSELLVVILQLRDKLVTELRIKNKFISAMLRVQSLRHSTAIASGSGIEFTGRLRSRSLRNKSSDEKEHGKFLSSIIPYHPPEDSNWSVNGLQILTDLLNAIAEGNDNVPVLVSDYLKMEVL